MKVRVRKGGMSAHSSYDFRYLERDDFFLIPCRIEEEKESICMSFDMRGMNPLKDLKEAEEAQKLAVLMQVGELEELYGRYEFSLSPDNLFFDISGRVRVMMRDLVPAFERRRPGQFLREYQALAGYMIEGSREFEDYLSGGLEILKGRSDAAELFEPETVKEEKAILTERLCRLRDEEKRNFCKVGKKRYKWMKIYSILSIFLMLPLMGTVTYGVGFYMPAQERFQEANAAYIRKDYTAMIDALKEFGTEDLSYTQKVMLAAAYIQGQAVDRFSAEDKETILGRINCQSSGELLDYWIHLGRLEVKEAEDLAMKMSDSQLLLYAYMHELDQVEDNGEMSGGEKRGRKQELMKEIRALAQELGISYGNGEEGVQK